MFNEQLVSPDAITVNAVHMYLLGPTAVGELIIGQSRCGVEAAAPNAAPTGTDDVYEATAGQALSVPAAGVLANDTDPDGQPLRASTLAPVAPADFATGNWNFPSDPAQGSLRLNVDGSFTDTPDEDFAAPTASTTS